MSQPSNSAVRGSPASSAAAAPPVAATGDFVVNLCASTTPMALEKPSSPELARYTFFVSRRREEGRERFRLHMGYFATREDAEQMLLLVRDLYPAAWVGETPGRKLASSATARASAPVTPAAVTPRAAPAPVPAQSAAPPLPVAPPKPAAAKVEPRAAVPPASNVREVLAALEPEAEAPASTSRTRTRTRTIGDTGVTVAMPILQGSLMAAAAAPTAVATPSPPVSPQARPTPAASAAFLPTSSRAAVPPTAASAVAPAAAKSAGPATTPTAPVPVPAVRTTSPGADMTDSQVLRVLEGRNNAAQACVPASAEGRDIALLSPQDTQTWRDIKAQIKRDAVVHFAVQLNWSVTPIDLARVPSLAIFNAYTLYKIEGNREGRKWYGLRLGFFSDAVSAKQVAHYVRSEFAQVAVVPVGINEREQAKQIGAIALPATTPAPRSAPQGDHEFRLIDDDAASPPSAAAAFDDVPPVVDLAPAPAAPAQTATRAAAAANRRPNRPRGAPQSLEETLEILGASQLSIDSGRGERVVMDARSRASDSPTSTFGKLLDRLGEKLRK